MTETTASNDGLVIAVPSKGRLQENTLAFFARAGLPLSQEHGGREYRGFIKDMPGVDVLFLSASEIAAHLADGRAHLGITGEDLVRESVRDADRRLLMVTALGFGHADVVVAVPKAWIDVRSMTDLEEVAADFHARHGRRMRVATKYVHLTRAHFAAFGVHDYRIVESIGATEGAPASGNAELIVDITTTGATLAANGLKVIDQGVVLRSQANLVAGVAAPWSAHARQVARSILARIDAERRARTSCELRVFGLAGDHADALTAVADLAGEVVGDPSVAPFTIRVTMSEANLLAERLMACGAQQVTVARQDYVFDARTPLWDRLAARLG
jgi:ATP phosphoribosyltransferase